MNVIPNKGKMQRKAGNENGNDQTLEHSLMIKLTKYPGNPAKNQNKTRKAHTCTSQNWLTGTPTHRGIGSLAHRHTRELGH